MNVRRAPCMGSRTACCSPSPGIFRAFIRRDGAGRRTRRRRQAVAARGPAGRVAPAGRWRREPARLCVEAGRARGRSHPRRRDPCASRFVDPVPPINLALVRGRRRGGPRSDGLSAGSPAAAGARTRRGLGVGTGRGDGAERPGALSGLSPGTCACWPLLGHAAWRRGRDCTLRYRANLRRRRRYDLRSAGHSLVGGSALSRARVSVGPASHPTLVRGAASGEPAAASGRAFAAASAAFVPTADEFGGVGGDPAIHGVEPDETEIWMDLEDRVGSHAGARHHASRQDAAWRSC